MSVEGVMCECVMVLKENRVNLYSFCTYQILVHFCDFSSVFTIAYGKNKMLGSPKRTLLARLSLRKPRSSKGLNFTLVTERRSHSVFQNSLILPANFFSLLFHCIFLLRCINIIQ